MLPPKAHGLVREAGVESFLPVSLKAHTISNHSNKQPLLESLPESPGMKGLPLASLPG